MKMKVVEQHHTSLTPPPPMCEDTFCLTSGLPKVKLLPGFKKHARVTSIVQYQLTSHFNKIFYILQKLLLCFSQADLHEPQLYLAA